MNTTRDYKLGHDDGFDGVAQNFDGIDNRDDYLRGYHEGMQDCDQYLAEQE